MQYVSQTDGVVKVKGNGKTLKIYTMGKFKNASVVQTGNKLIINGIDISDLPSGKYNMYKDGTIEPRTKYKYNLSEEKTFLQRLLNKIGIK